MILKPKLFIDTGGWIALMSSEDQYHFRARLFYQQLHPTVHRLTTSHVIAETYTWLRYRAGFTHASQFMQIARQATDQGNLTVKTDNPAILAEAEQLLLRYSDQKLSYVDAISMAVMREEKISQVFGFDRHFRILNFELVPE